METCKWTLKYLENGWTSSIFSGKTQPIENLRQINNNSHFDPENRSYCEWEVILPPPIDRVCVN